MPLYLAPVTSPELTAPRDHLVRALEADLIGPFRKGLPGPGGSDGQDSVEELKLPPSRWYLTGFLAPEAGREEEPEANEELAVGSDETEEDTGGASPGPKKKNFMPASLGLTVFVPRGVTKLRAIVRYANYDRVEREDPATGKKVTSRTWTRVPMPPVTEEIDLTDGSLEGDGIAVQNAGGLRLEGQIRPVWGWSTFQTAPKPSRSFS